MKPFRKNVAIAIDGGGIRGVIVTKALSILEQHLGKPVHDIFRLGSRYVHRFDHLCRHWIRINRSPDARSLYQPGRDHLQEILADTLLAFDPLPLSTRTVDQCAARTPRHTENGRFLDCQPADRCCHHNLRSARREDLLHQTMEDGIQGLAGHLGRARLQFSPNFLSGCGWPLCGWWSRLLCQSMLPGGLRGAILSEMGPEGDHPDQPGNRP